jgi:hypothetical protein
MRWQKLIDHALREMPTDLVATGQTPKSLFTIF